MDELQIAQTESPNGSRILTLDGALPIRTLLGFQDLLRQQDGSLLILDTVEAAEKQFATKAERS